MKRHIVIGIRYSLLIKNTRSWSIARNIDFDVYKEQLFDYERMKVRENLFLNFTIKSLSFLYENRPKDVEFKVYLLTSIDLPEKNKNFILALEEKYNFMEIKFYSPENVNLNQHLISYMDENMLDGDGYASVRLDDDDALSLEWLIETCKFIDAGFSNIAISLSKGLAVMVDQNGIIEKVSSYKYRFFSAGLTYIGIKGKNIKSVYQCGSHTKVDDTLPTLVYSKDYYFIRTFNGFNDSGKEFPNRDLISFDSYKVNLESFGIFS